MKTILIIFLFSALTSASETIGLQVIQNSLDELLAEALEYIRYLLKIHGSYTLPPLPDHHFINTDVDFVFCTKNVQITNLGDFIIDKISNNLPLMHSSFGLTFLTPHIQGYYKIRGTAFRKTVQGSGTFTLDISQLIETGVIEYAIMDHSLQIKDLNLNYSIIGLETSVQGFEIEGLTPAQVQDFLNQQFLVYFDNDKPLIIKKVAAHMKEVANHLMKGKTLEELIDWLKRIVASTPNPPPFTFE